MVSVLPMAISALVFSFLMVLVEDAAKVNLAGLFMAHITFAIMLVVLVLVALQAWRRVLMTWLIFVSLLSMVVAMFIRLFAENADPFYERYALIIAFTFEAFIFAFVVSARIQNMKQRKLIAESEANTDELCSVLNRRGWIKQASDLLAKQKTKGGLVGVLYIDLDDFKAVNDSYGHDIGDKVLEIVANIIRNHVRQSDLVGRVGGDEFVVFGLFPCIHSPPLN